MDRTGLIDKIVVAADDIDNGRKWLATEGHEADGRESYVQGLAYALEGFREAQSLASQDLGALILAEYAFITQELAFCSLKDTRTIASLKKAIQSFDDALLALEAVSSGIPYCISDKIYPHWGKHRYQGMPCDAFHIACMGHKTRLENNLRTPGINLLEKNLLEQRLSNMYTAQLIYLKKQKEVFASEK